MKVHFELDTNDTGDQATLQKFIDVLRDADVPAVPDALESIAPEPPVETAPQPEEVTPPPPPPVPDAPHPAPMAPPAPAGFDDVDDDPVPPAAAATEEAAPELDNQGVPWDGRIHASSKAITAKGNWKRKRGVDDRVYSQVLAELMGASQATAEAHQAEAETEAVLEQTAVPEPPATPDPAEAGFGGNGSAEMSWPDLVQKVMTAKVQELVSQEQLDGKCAELGVTGGFNNLVGRPDLYTRFIMELGL